MSKGQVPTNGLARAMKAAKAKCLTHCPQIEYLESLAAVMPEIEEMVLEVRLKHDHLDKCCSVGLGIAGGEFGSTE